MMLNREWENAIKPEYTFISPNYEENLPVIVRAKHYMS